MKPCSTRWPHSATDQRRRTDPFTAALIADMLHDGGLNGYLDGLRRTLHRRLTAMDEALQTHLPPDVTYRRPDAGYFIWLRFPETVDTTALLPIALACGVGFQPGPVYDELTIRSAVANLGTSLAGLARADTENK